MMAVRVAIPSILATVAVIGFVGHAVAQLQDTPLDCVVRPKATIELGSPEEGVIAEISVDRGEIVKKGQVVARLESKLQELAAEVARLRAESDVDIRSQRARLEFREVETERAEKLYEKSIVATKILDEAEIEKRLAGLGLETARLEHKLAQVEFAHAREKLERRSIKSPVDGVVVEVSMALGEFAHEQSPIMTIAVLDPLHVEAFVPAGYYGSVGVGTRAQLTMQQPIGGLYEAKVTVVDRVFDPASRTFGVRLDLPNSDYKLPAGLICKLWFDQDEAEAQGLEVDEDLDVFSSDVQPPKRKPLRALGKSGG